MRAGTRRRIRLMGRVVAMGALIGVVYSTLHNLTRPGSPLTAAVIGAIQGLAISAAIGALEIFGKRTRPGQALEQAPFSVTLAGKALVYGAIIALVNLEEPGTRLLGLRPVPGSPQLVSLIFSFAATLAFIFVLQISRIVGGRTLRDWVLGRYHRPRREDRFFLFVDIVGSTTLAERIGPVGVHQFLNRVFLLASDPVDDQRGEIYQYVGDEIVITWTEAEGRPGARPLACFFGIESALAAAAPAFTRDFGLAPRVRGALHGGPVIAGEVGGSKRDIVFHGDVMNTTSRLEQVARELGRPFVVSGDALGRLANTGQYALDDLGEHALRGRTSPIRVYAVAASPPAAPPAQSLAITAPK